MKWATCMRLARRRRREAALRAECLGGGRDVLAMWADDLDDIAREADNAGSLLGGIADALRTRAAEVRESRLEVAIRKVARR